MYLKLFNLLPESKQIVIEHINSNSNEAYDIEIKDMNGNIMPLETKGADMIYKDGKARFVYIRDIAFRRQAEIELKKNEEKFRDHFL